MKKINLIIIKQAIKETKDPGERRLLLELKEVSEKYNIIVENLARQKTSGMSWFKYNLWTMFIGWRLKRKYNIEKLSKLSFKDLNAILWSQLPLDFTNKQGECEFCGKDTLVRVINSFEDGIPKEIVICGECTEIQAAKYEKYGGDYTPIEFLMRQPKAILKGVV
jgi:hypothetical protein